jgi:hypothetical protein
MNDFLATKKRHDSRDETIPLIKMKPTIENDSGTVGWGKVFNLDVNVMA